MKKKIIKMKKIDPESLDSDDKDSKEDEPEVTVNSKGAVSLKPKDSVEDKLEKAREESKSSTPLNPIIAPTP